MLIGVMHTSMRINSLGLVVFQLMGCNKQCKMLSNFLPSYDTLSRDLKIRHRSHQRVKKTRRWKKEGSSAQCLGVWQQGQTLPDQEITNVMKGGKENSRKRA